MKTKTLLSAALLIGATAGDAHSQGSQGGAMYSSGTGTLTVVGVSDPATRQLLRDRKQGPGRMTLTIAPVPAETVHLYLGSSGQDVQGGPIPQVELKFSNSLLAEFGFPPGATPTVILSKVTIIKVQDRTSAADDMSLSLNFENLTWHPRDYSSPSVYE